MDVGRLQLTCREAAQLVSLASIEVVPAETKRLGFIYLHSSRVEWILFYLIPFDNSFFLNCSIRCPLSL